MMSHHIITIALLISSYITNFTRVGCLILVLMDWCDVWLAFAKMLRYFGLSNLCDAAFMMFLVSWLVTRQILYPRVVISAIFDGGRLMEYKWEPETGYFFNRDWYIIFISLLLSLQLIMCVWFYTICRITWAFISGQNVEDTRSDEEGESPESDEDDSTDGSAKSKNKAR